MYYVTRPYTREPVALQKPELQAISRTTMAIQEGLVKVSFLDLQMDYERLTMPHKILLH